MKKSVPVNVRRNIKTQPVPPSELQKSTSLRSRFSPYVKSQLNQINEQQILRQSLARLSCLFSLLVPHTLFAFGGCSKIINQEAADIRRTGMYGVFALLVVLVFSNIGADGRSKLSRVVLYLIWSFGLLLLLATFPLFVTMHGLRAPAVVEYLVSMDVRSYFAMLALAAFGIDGYQRRSARAGRKRINFLIGWAAVICLLLYSAIILQYFGTLREPPIKFDDSIEPIEFNGRWICPRLHEMR